MFVLYLSDQRDGSYFSNQYGYYGGKCFKKDDCVYPAWDAVITDKTKRYKSKVRAITAGDILLEKCSYVLSYNVEEITSK